MKKVSVDEIFRKAAKYEENNRDEDASNLYALILSELPGNKQATERLKIIAAKSKQQDSQNVSTFYDRAQRLSDSGDFDAAIEFLTTNLSEVEKDADLSALLSYCDFYGGKFERSKHLFISG